MYVGTYHFQCGCAIVGIIGNGGGRGGGAVGSEAINDALVLYVVLL